MRRSIRTLSVLLASAVLALVAARGSAPLRTLGAADAAGRGAEHYVDGSMFSLTATDCMNPFITPFVIGGQATGGGTIVFSSFNLAPAFDFPNIDTTFTLSQSASITSICNYHWNLGQGATPGMIGIADGNGTTIGTWAAVGLPSQGGALPAGTYWLAQPNITLPAGQYTILDSDNSTWAYNDASHNEGMSQVLTGPPGAAAPASTTTSSVPSGPETMIFDNFNGGGVSNRPTTSTTFTITQPAMITSIRNYHWNNGKGTVSPGTISLRSGNGAVSGPWLATGAPGQGGVPNAYWTAQPQQVIPAGTYTIVDSDPSTWAQDSGTGGAGMSQVKGILGAATTSASSASTQAKTCNEATESGGTGIETHNYEMGVNGGSFSLEYDMENIPDQLEVFYQGQRIYTTGGLVSGSKTVQVSFGPGASTQITVTVTGSADTGTVWSYTVNCP